MINLATLGNTDEMDKLLITYLILHHGEWPLTDGNKEDFELLTHARCAIFLMQRMNYTLNAALDLLESGKYEMKVSVDYKGTFGMELINTKMPAGTGYTVLIEEGLTT